MARLNRVEIIGNLGRDPEVRHLNNSTVVNLAVGIDGSYTDKNGNKVSRTDWMRCVLWGRTAEFAQKHLSKGAEVLVIGRLRTDKYKDKKDGIDRYTVDIVADEIVVIRWPNTNKGTASQGKDSRAGQNTEPAQAPLPQGMSNEDDIPF